MIPQKDLDFFVENNYNVIFRGKHGVGKTSIILDTFKKHNLKFKMFSASTMDPWVDFVGIPKEKTTEDGTPYLDLIRPLEFQRDEVEAIFMDEYNRSNHKIRNACMELIQFKSINGKKFNNLKMVWIAINPKEDGNDIYDVEELDPAQIDRFHALIDLPYKPETKYFISKYSDYGKYAVEWWESLNQNNKNKVSPRRLDYLLEIYLKGGELSYIIPPDINIKSFISKLASSDAKKLLSKALESKNEEDIKKIVTNNMYFEILKKDVLRNLEVFVDYIPEEQLFKYLDENNSEVISYFKLNISKHLDLIQRYSNSNSNSQTKNEFSRIFINNQLPRINSSNASLGTIQDKKINQFRHALNNVKTTDDKRELFFSFIKEYHTLASTVETNKFCESLYEFVLKNTKANTFHLRNHFHYLIKEGDLEAYKQSLKNGYNLLNFIKTNYITSTETNYKKKFLRLMDHFNHALVQSERIPPETKGSTDLYFQVDRISKSFRIKELNDTGEEDDFLDKIENDKEVSEVAALRYYYGQYPSETEFYKF